MALQNSDKMAKSAYYQKEQVPIDLGGYGALTYQKGGLAPSFTPSEQLLATQGLFNTNIGAAGGGAAALTPQIVSGAQGLFNTGAQQVAAAGAYDPAAEAKARYDLLMQGIAPQQEQARNAAEARLLAQGRLDSSGGALQYGALTHGQDVANAELLAGQYDAAQQERNRALLTGAGLTQQGAQLQGGLFGELLQGSQGYNASFDPFFNLLSQSQGIKVNDVNRRLGAASQVANIAGQKGPSMLSGLLGAAGTAAGAYFGGPLGAAAGKYAAGLFGGGDQTGGFTGSAVHAGGQ